MEIPMIQPDLAFYASCDDLILAETNVKKIERHVASTEKGDLALVYNGEYYYFALNGEDVTTQKLIKKVAPVVLEDFYQKKHALSLW